MAHAPRITREHNLIRRDALGLVRGGGSTPQDRARGSTRTRPPSCEYLRILANTCKYLQIDATHLGYPKIEMDIEFGEVEADEEHAPGNVPAEHLKFPKTFFKSEPFE